MKWKLPKSGDTRIKGKFLFWPLELDNEVRWLEYAYVLQKYEMGYNAYFSWINQSWATKINKENQ